MNQQNKPTGRLALVIDLSIIRCECKAEYALLRHSIVDDNDKWGVESKSKFCPYCGSKSPGVTIGPVKTRRR